MQVLPGQVAMVPNTAVAFLLAGLALWLRASRAGRSPVLASRAAAAVAGLLGLLNLVEYVSGKSLGIDELLFRDPAGLTSVFPGRMAVITALGFVALAAALLTLDLRWAPWTSDGLALLPGVFAMVSLTGYAFGARSLYWIGVYKGMAIHTALAFLVLAVGVLLVHAGGLSRLLVSDTAGGVAARRILPAALLVPLLLGWLQIAGERSGLYSPELGRALDAVSDALILTVILLGTAAALMRADEKRRSSEETLRKLFQAVEQSPASIVITGLLGNIEYVNPKFTRVTGYSSEEVVGKNPRILKSGEAPPDFYRDLWSTITAGREWQGEFHNRKKNGELFWEFASISPVFDEKQKITHFIASKEDITERKRAAEELAKREVYFRSLIEHSLDIVAVIAPDGELRYVSPSGERILGYPAADLPGLNAFDLIHPDDRSLAEGKFRRSLETGTKFEQLEVRIRHRDGSWRTLSFIGRPLPPETGMRGLIINARDQTDRQQLEAQLRVSQKMEGIGRLAGGIAHDFNNLLTAILGYSELMEAQLPDDEDLRSSLHEIHRAGERAAALTRQLLAFSRKQVLQPRLLDLNTIVSEVEKLLRRLIGEDVKLVTRLDPALGSVRADPGQLEQVLMNLAVNARDAMPEGGTLTVETANTVLDAGFAAGNPGARSGEYAALTVADTGIGMSDEVRNHAFEPFFTTKEQGKGTGLGLATAYGIVKQSDGYITVASEPGRGTTFRIYFPRATGAAAPSGLGERPALSPRGTETILLVEDESGVRRLSCTILEAQGYTVLEAASGDEALEIARSHAGEIHLLATDVVMPGMSGRVLWDRLRVLRRDPRVLFMSGYTDDAIARHGVLEPGIAFLQKPFTPFSLAQKVREVLDAPVKADA
jgi:PAS domain S-box-containing protein